MSFFIVVTLLISINCCLGDVSHIVLESEYQDKITTIPPPPVPYSFNYKAGRYPGHVDRFRAESGDGAGVVHGNNY